MSKFKVGDRVAVYETQGRRVGVIEKIDDPAVEEDPLVKVKCYYNKKDGSNWLGYFRKEQLRKLKKKSPSCCDIMLSKKLDELRGADVLGGVGSYKFTPE